MALEIRDLKMTYRPASGRELVAVDGFNLTVEPREIVALIGPSGCGKSTVLHSMGGLLTPTSGTVSYSGQKVKGPRPELASFVFQEYTLFPWKNILDNTALGLRFAGVSKLERRERAMEKLATVGLTDFADAYPGELSGGMQQRVAVARALTVDPEVLLMDEPFGALDEMSRRTLGVEMSRVLHKEDKTVVLVTHSLDEAIYWADRVVIMSSRPGRIIEEIRVDEPRPRRLEMMQSASFNEARTHLLSLLAPAEEAAVNPKVVAP